MPDGSSETGAGWKGRGASHTLVGTTVSNERAEKLCGLVAAAAPPVQTIQEFRDDEKIAALAPEDGRHPVSQDLADVGDLAVEPITRGNHRSFWLIIARIGASPFDR